MVVLPKPFYEQICLHAEAAYPEECCGLLLGQTAGANQLVGDVWETENVAEAKRHRRYCVPPEALLAADNHARKMGWEVLGVYHSHPDHPAEPSRFDRTRAIVQFQYLIVSVLNGQVADMKCWILQDWDDTFESEKLCVAI
jgi:proteasome lid subunit RPN8/RPN11